MNLPSRRWLGVLSVTLVACSTGDAPTDARDALAAVDASDATADRSTQSDANANDAWALDAAPRDAATPIPDAADGAAPGLVAVPPPAPPVFSPTIGTLSVTLRTADLTSADTDSPIELCLSATRCFALNLRDVDDFRRAGTDVYHFEGVRMARSDVDRVVLRTTSPAGTNNNRYSPACLDLRFDGEPVYCNDAITAHIGTGATAGEVVSWRDPAGLRNRCTTCLANTLPGGPMLGAPTSTTARVWVRTDATRRVGLFVSEQPDGAGAVALDWAFPRPTADFTDVLEARGLAPNRAYAYRVVVEGETPGPFRPMRTAPSSAGVVRIGLGSCARDVAQPIYNAIRAADLNLMVFLGDNHYGNTPYLEAHRWQYRQLDANAPRRSVLATVPSLATWDDHDFVANNSDGACGGKADALRGFSEGWANPSYGTATTPGVFTQARFGPVEVILADCRYHRPRVNDPDQRCTLAGTPPPADPRSGPIGAAQFTWLVDAIARSTAAFKLVGCGSLFTGSSVDSWESFPLARERLFNELAARDARGVVFISGDIHRSEVRVTPRPTGYAIPELVSSPMAQFPMATNADRTACDGTDPRRRFCYPWDSFMSVEVDGAAANPTLTAVIHDERGAARYRYVVRRSELE
jgi:alkaline phosphatase D